MVPSHLLRCGCQGLGASLQYYDGERAGDVPAKVVRREGDAGAPDTDTATDTDTDSRIQQYALPKRLVEREKNAGLRRSSSGRENGRLKRKRRKGPNPRLLRARKFHIFGVSGGAILLSFSLRGRGTTRDQREGHGGSVQACLFLAPGAEPGERSPGRGADLAPSRLRREWRFEWASSGRRRHVIGASLLSNFSFLDVDSSSAP